MLIRRLFNHSLPQASSLHFQVFSLFSDHRMSVLSSQYHKLGPTQFKMSRNIQRHLGNNLNAIQRIQIQLDKCRQTFLSLQNQSSKMAKGSQSQMEAYLNVHSELVKTVQKCQLNNEWIFKMIGWYNMTSFYHLLFGRLFNAGNSEIRLLVDAMCIMKLNEPSSSKIIQDLVDKQQSEKLYKHLPLDLDIDLLQKIENMFEIPANFQKRKYYSYYVPKIIQEVLRKVRAEDYASISDIIWLLHTSNLSFVDNRVITGKIEKCLMMINTELKKEDTQKLIDIYTRQGQISKSFYEKMIKPYLVKNYMSDIDSLVKCVKFIICSQCDDYKFLEEVFKGIAKVYVPSMKISANISQTLHIFKHYLAIKEMNYYIPGRLHLQLVQSCASQARTNPSVKNLVYTQKQKQQPKVKHVGSHKATNHNHETQCLTGRCLSASECSKADRQSFTSLYGYKTVSQFDFQSMKLYKNVRFCEIQMNYFLSRENSSEYINLQTEGANYTFDSGNIMRQKSIKDEILNHYGIRTIYLGQKVSFAKGKMSESEFLMQHRVTNVNRVAF